MLTSGLEQEHHPGGGQQKLTEMCVCALSSEGRTFELGRGVSRTNPPCQVGGSSRPALSNDPAAQGHSLPFLPGYHHLSGLSKSTRDPMAKTPIVIVTFVSPVPLILAKFWRNQLVHQASQLCVGALRTPVPGR